MKNEVIVTPHFERNYKRFAKKFASLGGEVDTLVNELLKNPTLGESLGAGLYKIRVAVESKGSGKSGGFRVITYLINQTKEGTDIYLVTIYDKSEESTKQKNVLLKLIKDIL
ncbi:hypothetical protein GCM10011514_02280 [Emticicia aquatilis]|uniref:Addiction module toxin RelE n=1 Tax=Emticicia aquatilis TaxID=1537369 RepID=A0A916YE37_9BACT|nr:type II toxin-antitoxin system RelE/ParE family toxin [Emticicia aquatilis]GGD41835.1 hypothetical protein GCM10011514_02280 [Emticicia aquatilis]